MQGTNSNQKQRREIIQSLKQSAFVSEAQRKKWERITSRPDNQQEIDDEGHTLKRANSLKGKTIYNRYFQSVEEELCQKVKVTIQTMMKEMNICQNQLTRFSNLSKVEQMITFLTERVKEKLAESQLTNSNSHKVQSKETETLTDEDGQLQMLKKKLHERDINERAMKTKIKDLHDQSRQLYDKINKKQNELSLKITEIYQLKITLKQQEKSIQNLQKKNELLQKEKSQQQKQQNIDSKAMLNANTQLQQQNIKLKDQIHHLSQQLQESTNKQNYYKKIIEDVAREWKEKLYQIVNKYQNQMQEMKEQIGNMPKQMENMEKKIFVIANEKYQVENKLIQKEKELYQLMKSTRGPCSANKQEAIKEVKVLEQAKPVQPSHNTKTVEQISNSQ